MITMLLLESVRKCLLKRTKVIRMLGWLAAVERDKNKLMIKLTA